MRLTLNLGCGSRIYEEYPPGYRCVNFDVRSNLDGVDVVGDVEDLGMFKDQTFNYILASDIIEHFPITKTEDLLKEWFRVLKSGGIIEIRTPNMEWAASHYIQHGDAKFVSHHIFGGQNYSGNFHYVMFDPEWLSTICASVKLIPMGVERPPGHSNFILRVYKK